MRNGNVNLSPSEKTHWGASKREAFGWRSDTDTGEFMWLEKRLLNIDHDYQRKTINPTRISKICKDWSWPACGVLTVFRRTSDNRHYVVDGQHRHSAALKRDDIQELPCLVFSGEIVSEEAKAFVAANTVRGPMKAVDAYRARIVANDPAALAISAALEEWGYKISNGTGQGRVSCIAALEKVYASGVDRFRRVLSIVCTLADGGPFGAHIFTAMGYLDYHLERKEWGNILRKDVAEKILKLGMSQCEESMRKFEALVGKGGERIRAAGILAEVNKSKRTNRIPAIYEV